MSRKRNGLPAFSSPTNRAAPDRPTVTARQWFKIENKIRENTADVWLYDVIGGWDGVTAQDFVLALADVNATSITLHVNSPGGDVFDGIAIYNAIRNHPADVTVRIEGLAASAASFIAMAGDTIVIERNAQMMIHDASGLAWGNAAVMREMADLLDKCSDNIADIYAQRTGRDLALWRADMLEETWYSADEALEAGLVDEIAGAASDAGTEGDAGDGSEEAGSNEEAPKARFAGSPLAHFGAVMSGEVVTLAPVAKKKETERAPEPEPVKVDTAAFVAALRKELQS